MPLVHCPLCLLTFVHRCWLPSYKFYVKKAIWKIVSYQTYLLSKQNLVTRLIWYPAEGYYSPVTKHSKYESHSQLWYFAPFCKLHVLANPSDKRSSEWTTAFWKSTKKGACFWKVRFSPFRISGYMDSCKLLAVCQFKRGRQQQLKTPPSPNPRAGCPQFCYLMLS